MFILYPHALCINKQNLNKIMGIVLSNYLFCIMIHHLLFGKRALIHVFDVIIIVFIGYVIIIIIFIHFRSIFTQIIIIFHGISRIFINCIVFGFNQGDCNSFDKLVYWYCLSLFHSIMIYLTIYRIIQCIKQYFKDLNDKKYYFDVYIVYHWIVFHVYRKHYVDNLFDLSIDKLLIIQRTSYYYTILRRISLL